MNYTDKALIYYKLIINYITTYRNTADLVPAVLSS